MGSANLPKLQFITDQLRVDNNAVGQKSETLITSGKPSAKLPDVSDSESKTASSATDAFPYMRAYGCLGRKSSEEK